MQWNDLKTNPPTGSEYAIILFPCKSDCGILYTTSNPQYAIKHGIESGYTHWAEIELAPDHDKWTEWQGSLTPTDISNSLDKIIDNLNEKFQKEIQPAKVWKLNDERNKLQSL
jgi:hypothetical protein